MSEEFLKQFEEQKTKAEQILKESFKKNNMLYILLAVGVVGGYMLLRKK